MKSVQILYDDENYTLFFKKGILNLFPMLTQYWLFNKQRKTSIKIRKSDQAYLLATIKYFISFGGKPNEVKSTSLLKEFSEAIAHRDFVIGKFFFQSMTANDRAKQLYFEIFNLSE